MQKLLRHFDYKTALFLVILSGFFSAVLIIGLAWYGLKYRPIDYLDDETFIAMKDELKSSPENTELKEKFRTEDLFRIKQYYLSQRKISLGAYFLFGGLLVFVFSLRRMVVLKEKLPLPLLATAPRKDPYERKQTLLSLLSIPFPIAILILLGFVMVRTKLSPEQESIIIPEEIILTENQKWTSLRGTLGNGLVEAMELPLSWDTKTGENIIWKVPVPGKGNSSPILWGDKIFLTGANKQFRKVFCIDKNNGSLKWTCVIRTPAVLDQGVKEMDETGFASPTMVTDGKFVFAFFGTCELVAVDFNGGQVWSRWFGKPESFYGVATSPVYHKGKIILQLDQGDPDNPNSVLYAINPVNGETIWETTREVPGSWSSPIVVNTGQRDEIITAANPWVISYDPKTGTELWRADVLSGDVAPIPAYGDGMVYTTTEYSQLSAIQTDGSGDVTDTQVKWTYDEDLPDVASPVTDGKFLLQPTGYGTVHCFDAKSGEILWTNEFDKGFWSSPILVGENIFLTDDDGTTFIFKLTETYQLLGEGSLHERVVTTPAFAEDRIYIRGMESLYCIGKKL